MNHTFAFPAEAGPHLPTPEGWKAELAWETLWPHKTCKKVHNDWLLLLACFYRAAWNADAV